jgi:GntR family transcriptional regulator / MocR family aminotransferase
VEGLRNNGPMDRASSRLPDATSWEVLADPRAGTGPMRVQLADQLRARIQRGELTAGTRLPSTRMLARTLAVSRGVCLDAYAQLRAEGWIAIEQTRRPVVRALPGAARTTAAESSEPSWRYDLAPEHPDLLHFPRAAWAAAQRRAITSATVGELGYGDPRGPRRARVTLVAHLARTRGALIDPDAVAFTNGFTQALHLLCKALATRGARAIAVEDPSPPYIRQTIARAGLTTRPVPVDPAGVDISRLQTLEVAAVLVTPARQYPSASRLSAERRAHLAQWAASTGVLLIEDDHDGDLLDRRSSGGVLQALAPDSVALIGSTAKALAPALRLGWTSLPPAIHAAVLEERWYADSGVAAVDALALASFIESGEFGRHLRTMRTEYRRRHRALAAHLDAVHPQARIAGLEEGLHVTIELPSRFDDAQIAETLRRKRIDLRALSTFRDQHPGPPGLVISVAQITPDSAPTIAHQIGQALRSDEETACPCRR